MQKHIVKGLGNTEQKYEQLYLCSHKKEKEKKKKGRTFLFKNWLY